MDSKIRTQKNIIEYLNMANCVYDKYFNIFIRQ